MKEKFIEFIIGTFMTMALFVSPIQGLIIMISSLVAFDTCYAIYWSIKTKGIASFTSHKLFNIVPKTFKYMSTILLAFAIDSFMFENSIAGISNLVSKSVSGFWCFIEFKSIDETHIKLGHKSLVETFKNVYKNVKFIKKDINEL